MINAPKPFILLHEMDIEPKCVNINTEYCTAETKSNQINSNRAQQWMEEISKSKGGSLPCEKTLEDLFDHRSGDV